ncbi:MAG: uridine kinase [Chloroflexi bacterium RBG_16_57_11]|nr:MAG: uridine kinase [Chloroflexi bacterium RBG_16_57_11]
MKTKSDSEIQFVEPGPTVEVHLPDGRVLRGLRYTTLERFLCTLPDSDDPPIVGAVLNGELRELTYRIKMDAVVRPVRMSDSDGALIYRRSLVFLMETAFDQCFTGATLTVDHSVSSGGYFCQVSGRPPLSPGELGALEDAMNRLVQADLPFERQETPIAEATAYFQATGKTEKVRLLAHRKKSYLTLYQLQEFRDYHHGYMVPSTGYLRWFKLTATGVGFTLRFPRRHAPKQLLPLPEYPKLLATFRQYGDWLDRLGIANVGTLNDAIQAGRCDEVILVSEALHEQHITEIARQIANRAEQVRVVLIAGPSSSGKTTFSKRLAVQLLACGIAPFALAMDNYFIDRDKTPLDEQGKPDFEALTALDREHMDSDLTRLISGEQVQLPHYNFLTGKSEEGQMVHLHSGEIIIMEGIHGLNPELFHRLSRNQAYRIYISALTQLNLDRHNRISTTDTRLIRRIVRDARERGYTASQTIQRWESVRRGEKRYIFPNQENADLMFNSALVYELSALKPLAEPLLRQVHFYTPEYIEAKRLLALLEWFLPLESDSIPDNSILREFIGSSSLSHFTLWHNHAQ